MDTVDILNKEFFTQKFSEEHPYSELLEKYKCIAGNYARMESAVAVLSDLRTNKSYIYYGNFSRMLEIDNNRDEDKVSSIWEKEIFNIIHPDDLTGKHLQELCFFHFVKHQPKRKRADYYLISKLRMKNAGNNYIPVLHRMFYIFAPSNDTFWLALCLYGPLLFDIPAKCLIVNSTNGQMFAIGKQDNTRILSVREKQVLNLIDKGMASKKIAETLSISIHTVSRHRQEILAKLQVRNSIEACRVAKDLKLI